MRVVFLLIFSLLASISYGDASEAVPWQDESCSFEKEVVKSSPIKLVEDFLKDSLEGKKNSEVIACPGHIGAPDTLTIVSSYKILSSDIKSQSATISVQFHIVGDYSRGGTKGELNSFVPQSIDRTVNYELINTPFGWRIDKFEWEYPKISAKFIRKKLLSKKWVQGDLEKFNKSMKAVGY